MLELFRKNPFVYNLFLLLYVVVLRFCWFVLDVPVLDESNGILTYFLFQLLGGDSIVIKIFTLLLILFQAIQINRLVSINRLTDENSLFPGLFYILIISFGKIFIPLHPQILANTFLIIMLTDIFRQTRNERLQIGMFNVGFWGGLASLFYFPYILFLITGILGVMYLRTFKSIDLLRTFFGVVVSYFLLGTGLFLYDRLPDFWSIHFNESFAFLDLILIFEWKEYSILILFGLAVILSLATAGNYNDRFNIHVRRKINVLLWVMIMGVLMGCIVADTGLASLLFFSVPLSVILGAMFLKMEKQIAEIVHFLLVAIALVFQYLL